MEITLSVVYVDSLGRNRLNDSRIDLGDIVDIVDEYGKHIITIGISEGKTGCDACPLRNSPGSGCKYPRQIMGPLCVGSNQEGSPRSFKIVNIDSMLEDL